LLQILDDGRLTDGHGRTVDFTNTVIIMTSNTGSEFIAAGENYEEMQAKVTEALRETFRPEFLNRVDEIITYHRLSREVMGEIVDIQLRGLSVLLKEQGLTLELTAAARSHLAELGYDPIYGARSLKRLITREVFDPLALKVLGGEFSEGTAVKADFLAGAMVFTALSTGKDHP
ncbi:MAG: AAA family ATPase, partial [Thermodesulfobacteriota bacterium]